MSLLRNPKPQNLGKLLRNATHIYVALPSYRHEIHTPLLGTNDNYNSVLVSVKVLGISQGLLWGGDI